MRISVNEDDIRFYEEFYGTPIQWREGKTILAGEQFHSDRDSEGWVRAVCDHGRCTHDNRPDSTHVRGGDGGQWFVVTGYDEFPIGRSMR